MINKLYEMIKENFKFLLLLLIIFILFTLKLPYYISAPGGLLNIKDKIEKPIKTKGSLNMAYVSQLNGTIPTLIVAIINPNWDIEKEKDITVGKETMKDQEYRNKMLLKEGNNNALVVAYNNSKIKYKIENNKVYVTYIDNLAKTNLKIKDQIIKIDNLKVKEKQDLYDFISTKKPNQKVKITVIRNKKKKICFAKLLNIKGKTKVGILITETKQIESKKRIKIKTDSSESGSSGGLMMSLGIYSNLIKKDLTSGKKIVGTGTIDEKGKVGEISGIKYKLIGATKNNSDIFLVPKGKNYKEAKKIKKQKKLKIKLVPVSTFKEALQYLENK